MVHEERRTRKVDSKLTGLADKDKEWVHYPYSDVLVIRAEVTKNGMNMILIDNESLVNIIFGLAFDEMKVGHFVTLITDSLYGFNREGIIPRGKITLAIIVGEAPK
ncbi:Uncharacterized protein Adt_03433 [Abeliophyllum distichum]|uniref:Uncharacterized protein n=1 Tax=Abeliophyllum distichum TaxID=126358 RepID=A0ABD1VYW9_9LAMI